MGCSAPLSLLYLEVCGRLGLRMEARALEGGRWGAGCVEWGGQWVQEVYGCSEASRHVRVVMRMLLPLLPVYQHVVMHMLLPLLPVYWHMGGLLLMSLLPVHRHVVIHMLLPLLPMYRHVVMHMLLPLLPMYRHVVMRMLLPLLPVPARGCAYATAATVYVYVYVYAPACGHAHATASVPARALAWSHHTRTLSSLPAAAATACCLLPATPRLLPAASCLLSATACVQVLCAVAMCAIMCGGPDGSRATLCCRSIRAGRATAG